MSTNDELYPSEQTQHFGPAGAAEPDPRGSAGRTDLIDPFADEEVEDDQPGTRWHAGLDLGLLVLRVAVGGSLLLNGLYKFGMFGGPGIEAWPEILTSQGFTSQTEILSWVLALTEVGAGGALILGLLTPLAAAGVLGVTLSATYMHKDIGYFPMIVEGGAQFPGYAHPLLIGAGALALLLTGPGRIAMDAPFAWRKRPLGFGVFGLVLAVAAALAVFALFR